MSASRLSRANLILRQVGPQPVTLVREVSYRLWRRLRDTVVSRAYGRLVLQGPGRDDAFVPLPIALCRAEQLSAPLQDSARRIQAYADAALQHQVDLLGSGPVALGDAIDWHRDFKSGYRWEPRFYRLIEVTRLDDSSDAKVPWELSRCHHFVALARAARLFQRSPYLEELGTQWDSWLADNPPGIGINWANTMEVAIRATNWVWALSTLSEDDRDQLPRKRILRSLHQHGHHIAWNLEGTPRLRSNHYLADMLGMLSLGAALRGAHARYWFRRAHRAFERQIRLQVLPDGVSFEASLGYHGLALEMFLLARQVADWKGRPFSNAYDERLRRMVEVSRAVRHADGRIPMFGDFDSGRILPAISARPPSHDHLLWLATAQLESCAALDGNPSGEVAWTLGPSAWERCARLSYVNAGEVNAGEPAAFPDGGIYVLRGGGAHLVTRCGDLGQNGNGGHAHNDALSYELAYGRTLVVDSGTYLYTADPAARNAFRATSAHNTVVVDGEEINPIAAGELFRLRQVARPVVQNWEVSDELVRLVAVHDGYRRVGAGPLHRREFRLDRASGKIEIRDELAGGAYRDAVSFIHFAPNAEVGKVAANEYAISCGSSEAAVRFDGSVAAIELTSGWVSDRYGVRQRAPLLQARFSGGTPALVSSEFTPR
jgi:Heparinase II/III-like protein/Heparinase II/III N-terminus